MLITMPTPNWYYAGRADAPSAEAAARLYRSPHWDEPNVLAHVRVNDRDIGGKKTLFIEEVQSDWHQQGKRQGYRQPLSEAERPEAIEQLHELEDQLNKMHSKRDTAEYAALEVQAGTLRDRITGNSGVPDAPFKTSWPELSLKRVLKYAADHDYDQIAWTPGHVQAARYDLSKHIDRLEWERGGTSGFTPLEEIEKTYPDIDTWGTLRAWDKRGEKVLDETRREKDLPETIGKEAADRLLGVDPKRVVRGGTAVSLRGLEGADLKIGGEGMNKFYDEILPATANKIGKRFGARVQRTSTPSGDLDHFDLTEAGGGWRIIDTSGSRDQYVGPVFRSGADAERWLKDKGHTNIDVHTLPITDALRRMAKEKGFPLFKRGGAVRPIPGPAPPVAKSFKMPPDALRKLGSGSPDLGHVVLNQTLGFHPLAAGLGEVPAETVTAAGGGDHAAGHSVLRKWVARIRQAGKPPAGKTVILRGQHGTTAINVSHK
jgi:hypothetical protein